MGSGNYDVLQALRFMQENDASLAADAIAGILAQFPSATGQVLRSGVAARINVGPERIAVGVAADQVDGEIARVKIERSFKAGDILRVTAVMQTNGLASDVAKFFNLAIGPSGGSYAGASKIMNSAGFSQLVATAAGNSRVTFHQLHVLIDTLTSQFFINGTGPVAVVGPSSESGVMVPLAIDMTGAALDLMVGGYFAASAPAGANIKVRKILAEIL